MDLAGYIDHTLLKPDATPSMIDGLCREAIDYSFFSVCVNPVWVPCASISSMEGDPLSAPLPVSPWGPHPSPPGKRNGRCPGGLPRSTW